MSIRNILTLAGLYLVYYVLRAIYNISPLHPLSRIPGPKLAGATYWPEFYYDVVKNGCYTKEIAKMHVKYGNLCQFCFRKRGCLTKVTGPIVRINPYEVHCNDISFADEIYAVGGRKRDKPVHQINGSV